MSRVGNKLRVQTTFWKELSAVTLRTFLIPCLLAYNLKFN